MSETDMLIEDGSVIEEGNTIEEESIIEEGNTIEEESIWKNWRIIAALFVIHFIQVKVWLSCIIQGS